MGWLPLIDCLHRGDPRIKTSPQRFDPDFNPTGIFQLSTDEQFRRTLKARVIGLENFVERVAADNTRLKQKVESLADGLMTLEEAVRAGVAPKRGPGRPKKSRQAPELAPAG